MVLIYKWYSKTVFAAPKVTFLNGDEAVLIKNRDVSRLTKVTVYEVAKSSGMLSLQSSDSR
ncbi:unnamed protein product [Dracunculus medinensis]|uniref:MSP domain-containing protein n=1 Tax=Dracunculus medinensis TaxID=318479 RepID=A0A0N4UB25_DRAME|nr:unnamed protein product [Dracunculus medinensis]